MKRAEDSGSGQIEGNLRLLAKARGKDPDQYVNEQLGQATLPDAYMYLWKFYRTLASRRSFDEIIPNPIPLAEIEAYARLLKIRLDVWEIEILLRVDEFDRKLLYDSAKKKSDAARK